MGLIGSRRAPLEALGADLGLPADRWMAVDADLREQPAAESAVAAIADRFGSIDALVHVVGGYHGGEAVVDVRDAEVGAMLAQHVWTTLNMVRAAVPRMTTAGWGRVVAVSTPKATAPTRGSGPYAAAKAAQEALLSTLAREVAGTGVTANLIVVHTIDFDHVREREPSPKNAMWTTPEAISAAMVFLLSEAAAEVNGAKLPMYGNG